MDWSFVLGVLAGTAVGVVASHPARKECNRKYAQLCREELAAMVREGRALQEADTAQGDR